MFWKKKNSSHDIDFTYESDDQREYFRVTVPEDYEPDATLKADNGNRASLTLKDISCGGFACIGCKLNEDKTYTATLLFPDESKLLSIQFEVLQVDADDISHCRFINLTDKDINKIYHYVLEVQKRALR